MDLSFHCVAANVEFAVNLTNYNMQPGYKFNSNF
jgi:hypothetical protein